MFGVPRDDDSFFWLSQLVQAEYLRVGVEHFRRLQPHCQGALYWQINDCWPVASWASIDYLGRWKALHYAARRFFAPVLLSLQRDEAGLSIFLVSDQAAPVSGRLTVRLLDLDGAVRKTWRRAVGPRDPGARNVWTLPPSEVTSLDCARTVLTAELKAGRRLLARASWLLTEAVDVALPDPGLTVRTVVHGRRVEAVVTARSYAHSVLLEADGAEGRFEDNFFPLLPGESRRVKFRPRAKGAPPTSVRARSLVDLRTAPERVVP
jgi:beta-mannosidase